MHNCVLKIAALSLVTALSVALPAQYAIAAPAGEPPPAIPGEGNNRGGGEPTSPPSPPIVSTGVNDDGVISVDIASPGGSSGGGGPRSGPPTYGPTCEWTALGTIGLPSDFGALPSGGPQAVDDQGRLGWLVVCPGQPLDVRWTTPAVDPITLVDPAVGRALAQLPLPIPVQSPEPEIGSFVNLGLWFSIEEPIITPARASAGGAWAEATGRFVSFSVDPGDGTGPVPCAGFGVPYEEGSNTFDEGPCGHTYLQPTPADALHTVTYTIAFEVTWRTSDGRSGVVGTFDRSFDFPFDINEIQTRGAGSR